MVRQAPASDEKRQRRSEPRHADATRNQRRGKENQKQSEAATSPRATRRFVPMQLLESRKECDLNRGEHKDKERRECQEPRDRNPKPEDNAIDSVPAEE